MLDRVNVAPFTGSLPPRVSREYSSFTPQIFLITRAPCACVLHNFPRFPFFRSRVSTIFPIATDQCQRVRVRRRDIPEGVTRCGLKDEEEERQTSTSVGNLPAATLRCMGAEVCPCSARKQNRSPEDLTQR